MVVLGSIALYVEPVSHGRVKLSLQVLTVSSYVELLEALLAEYEGWFPHKAYKSSQGHCKNVDNQEN